MNMNWKSCSLCKKGDEAGAVLLQIIFMTGWAPHASQQRPMQRGSAEVTLESLQAELEKRKASKPEP